ncbi:hypothetical protein EV356DRAFT_519023 [Viridothelium virens]|uniref:Nephrocystin 3-like N-terminal domain-containing protein n=1 Tax=Viridothelium virens TaxID=1048519 RepID=A0A6A6H099_VIRVR|nr:hypothetical protein EV356DRAFT_519023 [Viridothelium virens]
MDARGGPSCRQSIPSTGLTVVVNPEKPSLDVIFVHGFTGHPERTWTHKRGDPGHQANEDDETAEQPSKIRKLGQFSKSHPEGPRPAIYWPRDLIPMTLPNSRVLVYGYDTHIRHKLGPPASQSTVYDIAWDFLVALEAGRRADASRPMLFIAHSLGGIIVKEMLRRSSSCRQLQSHLNGIFKSTVGIMFFGTPHGGADPRGILQRIAEMVFKIAGFSVNEQIVNTLLPTAERLRELRDEFGLMAQEQNWVIHSFQEQYGVTPLSGHKVVEDTSSYLNLPKIEVPEHIGRNHMEMCRFTGANDIEYGKVVSALHRISSSVSSQPRQRDIKLLTEKEINFLLNSLKFDQIDARQMTIGKAHTKTCKWLLENSKYVDWLDTTKYNEHHGFLWMKGKPGTGKSTLMKFALLNTRKTMKDRILISFFFNARGESLERSTTGLYRSLLLQLLERFPKLRNVFYFAGIESVSISASFQWSLETLKILIELAVQGLGENSALCFIDALDECEEYQVRDMISFFEYIGDLTVSAGVRLQVCFSSRHYPHITMRGGLDLVIEGQEGHNQDIANYLNSELKIGHSQIAHEIRREVQDKASNVFMWVVLVVRILNEEHDGGRIHALRRTLQEIPGDLHKLFLDILTRDSKNKNELILCIQWVLFATTPLTPEQLYFAILSGIEPEILSIWDSKEITQSTIRRFILNCSKGLAELTVSKVPKVQFIHESIKDFLVKDNGLKSIWPGIENNFQGQSHERLRHCCINYMNIDVVGLLQLDKSLPKASPGQAAALCSSVTDAFPFLEYAVCNVLYHADVAAGSGVAQEDFIQNFPLASWIYLDNLVKKQKARRYTKGASLLYLFAERDLSNLIRIYLDIPGFGNRPKYRIAIP